MAFKRKHYKNYKKGKKTNKKLTMSKQKPLLLANNRLIIPDRFRTSLIYSDTFNISGTGYGGRTFRMNNVYDPDFATGNYGCRGFNQLATLYSNYMCFGSKIEVEAVNNVITSSAMVTIVPSEHIIPAASITEGANDARPYAKTSKVMDINGSGQARVMLKNSCSVRKIFGINKHELYALPHYKMQTDGKSYLSSFLKTAYWNVLCNNVSVPTEGLSVAIKVKITYYVEFFGRVPEVIPTLTQEHFELDQINGGLSALGVTGATGGSNPLYDTSTYTGDSGNIDILAN